MSILEQEVKAVKMALDVKMPEPYAAETRAKFLDEWMNSQRGRSIGLDPANRNKFADAVGLRRIEMQRWLRILKSEAR